MDTVLKFLPHGLTLFACLISIFAIFYNGGLAKFLKRSDEKAKAKEQEIERKETLIRDVYAPIHKAYKSRSFVIDPYAEHGWYKYDTAGLMKLFKEEIRERILLHPNSVDKQIFEIVLEIDQALIDLDERDDDDDANEDWWELLEGRILKVAEMISDQVMVGSRTSRD